MSFKQGMLLANNMLVNEESDNDLSIFSVKLFEAIRKAYPNEWNADWKNDFLLGDAYFFITEHEKNSYQAYERASKNINHLPVPLLVTSAENLIARGKKTNSKLEAKKIYEEAEKMLINAFEKEQSIEAAVAMRNIFRETGDEKKFSYWSLIIDDLENKGAFMRNKHPEFLKENSRFIDTTYIDDIRFK